FGGQREYRITHQFFFSPRSLYLVVWDPRSGADKCDVNGWIERIKLRVGADATILVVATHARTGEPPPGIHIDQDDLRRKHGDVIAGFFETDSFEDETTNRVGIDVLREAISHHAAHLRGMGDPLPPAWKKARADILALALERTPWIPRDRFVEICRSHGMPEDSTAGLMILMHQLGQIVYFGPGDEPRASARADSQTPGDSHTLKEEDRQLGDVVILMPEWLAKAVCFV
ncbi:unnamed protein product, partial [marine sediment metagenome]